MKDVLVAIASRNYLATDAQITLMATANMEAHQRIEAVGSTYLKVLVAGVQNAMGLSPRLRAAHGKQPAHDADDDARVVNEIHRHYYELILTAVTTEDIADRPNLRQPEKSRRALERNRRSNFARSAKATLMAYVRAGGNVRTLVVPTLSKGVLRGLTERLQPRPKLSARQLQDRWADTVCTHVKALQEKNEDLAADVAQKLIQALSPIAACEKPTSSPRKSVAEGLPLRLDDGIFIPLTPQPTPNGEPVAH